MANTTKKGAGVKVKSLKYYLFDLPAAPGSKGRGIGACCKVAAYSAEEAVSKVKADLTKLVKDGPLVKDGFDNLLYLNLYLSPDGISEKNITEVSDE